MCLCLSWQHFVDDILIVRRLEPCAADLNFTSRAVIQSCYSPDIHARIMFSKLLRLLTIIYTYARGKDS